MTVAEFPPESVPPPDPIPMGGSQPVESKTAYKQCGAKKRRGGVCKAAAMPNGRCRLHGGLTPCGAASPHFKDGHRSKYIPKFLSEAYDDLKDDVDLNSLREEMRVQKAFALMYLRKMGEAQPPDWGKLKGLLKAVAQVKSFEDAVPILTEVADIVESGAASQKQMDTLEAKYNENVERTAKLGAVEWKRLVDLQGVVTLEQVMFLLRGLLASQREVLAGHPELLQKCQARLLEYLPAKRETPA